MELNEVGRLTARLRENITRVISGKDEIIDKVIICLLADGHILLEDLPGTGKTTLAKALARSAGCEFGRVQFTPDLLPSDLTGINFYNQRTSEFVFRRGAVFTGILLGDEINRATPRTQSSLLECMEERQVTVDGTTYPLDKPFLVIATQNPIEIAGTFPLPEAQLDRFLMRLHLGYPGADDEKRMLSRFRSAAPLETLEAVTNRDELLAAQEAVRQVHVSDAVNEYLVAIAHATRTHEKIRLGVSPRGCLALQRASMAHAAARGSSFVTPDDVKAVCADVIGHRLVLRGHDSAEAAAELIRQILIQVPVPIEG